MFLYIKDDIISTLVQREIHIEGTFVILNLKETNGFYAALTIQRET